MRISRQFNSAGVQVQEKRRVYLSMDVAQERDTGNLVTASYTRTGNIGGLLCRTTGSGPEFFGYDGSGNVTTLTNRDGATLATYGYDAWGVSTNAFFNTSYTAQSFQAQRDAAQNPYTFSSKEQLAGLVSFGYRFYSPGLGRWINRDPLRESGGTNLYEMVGNNPMNYVDPYGLHTDGPSLTDPAGHGEDQSSSNGITIGVPGSVQEGGDPAGHGSEPVGSVEMPMTMDVPSTPSLNISEIV